MPWVTPAQGQASFSRLSCVSHGPPAHPSASHLSHGAPTAEQLLAFPSPTASEAEPGKGMLLDLGACAAPQPQPCQGVGPGPVHCSAVRATMAAGGEAGARSWRPSHAGCEAAVCWGGSKELL